MEAKSPSWGASLLAARHSAYSCRCKSAPSGATITPRGSRTWKPHDSPCVALWTHVACQDVHKLTRPGVGAKRALVGPLSRPRVSAPGPSRAVRGVQHAVTASLVWGSAKLAIRVRVVPVASKRAQRHVREAALHRLDIHSVMHKPAEGIHTVDIWVYPDAWGVRHVEAQLF